MQRRDMLKICGTLGLTGLMPLAGCQNNQAITAVVPFPPGGGGDVLARSILEPLGKELGQTIVIQNRPGSGGNIGTRTVVKARDIAHTLGYVTNGVMCVNEYLYGKKDFDTRVDLVPVGAISKIGLMAVLNSKAVPGVTDWQTLIAYAKANRGALAYASSGVGTTSHLAGELLAMTAGLELNHIPHAGGAAAMTEVLAGRIPLMIDVMPNAIGHVRSGKLKALAVTTPERSALAPDVPTMIECGFAGYELFAWDGVVMPKGADAREVEHINEAMQKLLKSTEIAQRLAKLGAEPFLTTPETFAQFIDKERPKWAQLAGRIAANIR
ncbi:MAG: tripartite tricarboxylate transporter substrate binding protein [Sutterellaceae bacterium]|nr:tripartite tricarboxylate transporter substrate binding protein [Sutterellaceae bacterium]